MELKKDNHSMTPVFINHGFEGDLVQFSSNFDMDFKTKQFDFHL